jgi:hypothetical protein
MPTTYLFNDDVHLIICVDIFRCLQTKSTFFSILCMGVGTW